MDNDYNATSPLHRLCLRDSLADYCRNKFNMEPCYNRMEPYNRTNMTPFHSDAVCPALARSWPDSCSIPDDPGLLTALGTIIAYNAAFESAFWLIPVLILLSLLLAATNGLALATFRRLQAEKVPVFPLQVGKGQVRGPQGPSTYLGDSPVPMGSPSCL